MDEAADQKVVGVFGKLQRFQVFEKLVFIEIDPFGDSIGNIGQEAACPFISIEKKARFIQGGFSDDF